MADEERCFCETIYIYKYSNKIHWLHPSVTLGVCMLTLLHMCVYVAFRDELMCEYLIRYKTEAWNLGWSLELVQGHILENDLSSDSAKIPWMCFSGNIFKNSWSFHIFSIWVRNLKSNQDATEILLFADHWKKKMQPVSVVP